jgi:hypothetical protein
MYYLIHTNHHPRPYLSTISFIANDFANWGCRVTCHANDSAYMTEIRYQEKRNRPGSRRIELMEVWAKEVLARKQAQPHSRTTSHPTASPSTRKERASAFAQDFIASLSLFGPFHAPKKHISITNHFRIRTHRAQTPPQRSSAPPSTSPSPRRSLHPPLAPLRVYFRRRTAFLGRSRNRLRRPS